LSQLGARRTIKELGRTKEGKEKERKEELEAEEKKLCITGRKPLLEGQGLRFQLGVL
jgi:hypothetical protein